MRTRKEIEEMISSNYGSNRVYLSGILEVLLDIREKKIKGEMKNGKRKM
jgi:hypothetical protein